MKPAWWDEASVPFRVLWAKLVDVTWDAQMSPCNSAGNSRLWLYTGRTAAADSGQGPVKQRSQLCTSINVYFSLLLHQHIFSSFLSSNFYYTSIISIRTKSGRIHLNKTNFAAIIEKTREMRFQDTTVWRTTEFQWLDRARIPDTVPAVTGTTYTEKNIPRMSLSFIVFCFAFLPRLNCTVNIKTKNI